MLAQSAIIALIGVLALLLIFMLFASPSRLHKCCCFRRAPRRAVGVKAENRFDGMLFFWIIVHLAISAAWLRLIPQGDQYVCTAAALSNRSFRQAERVSLNSHRYGRGITYPLWLEDRPARFVSDDALQPTIEGFRMVTVEDSCDYNLKHTDKDYCGDKNPVVPVLATIDRVDNINMGLVMTVHSSGDFGWWQQSSTVVLPRDLAANRTVDVSNYTTTLFDPSFEAKLQSDGLAISSKACFGAPGAYYVVGCLRTGIPPNVGKRPQCSAPPCPGTVGPPFSSCLAIATACVSTCGSLATETKVPSKCINGSVPFHEIEKFAQPFGVLDPPFIGFIICYAVGLIYFFVMYMPGVGMVNGATPAWDIFISAAKEGGDGFVVPLERSRHRNSAPPPPPPGTNGGEASPSSGVPQGVRRLTLAPRKRLYSIRTMTQLPACIEGGGTRMSAMPSVLGSEHVALDLSPRSSGRTTSLGATPAPPPGSMRTLADVPPGHPPTSAEAATSVDNLPRHKEHVTFSTEPPLIASKQASNISTATAGPSGGPHARRGSYAAYRRMSVRTTTRFLPVQDPYDREVEMLDMAEDFAAQPPRPLASPRFALNPSPRQSHCTSQTSSRSLRNFSLRGPARPSLAQGAQGNPVYPAHMPSGLSHFGASSYAVRSRRASAMTNASSDEAPVIITRAPTAKSETSDGRSSPAIAGQVLEPVPSAASMPSSDPSIKGEAGEAEADLDVEGQGLLTDEQVAPAPMPTIASNRAMGRGAWGNNPRANLSGCTAVSFSISAGEGPNTILRNALGKICASLELAKNIKQTPGWQIVDGFADEGHRIGAYYLCRATWLAFYNAMHPTVALKVASSWLDAMNEHEHASNIDKFDKEKQTDLFALLSSSDLARPEICYVRFFFKLFRALNGFTVPVDDLFEYALTMPFCNSSEYSKAFEHIRERTSADEHLGVDELLETMISATSIQSTAHARVILNACLVSSKAPLSAPKSAPATAPTAGEDTDSTTAQPEAAESCTFSLETLMHDGLRAHARAEAAAAGFDPADVEDEEDEEDAVAISFFSPEFVREFGMLLGGELKGRYHPQGDLKVPLDTAAYVTCLSKLQGEPLGCDAFQSLSQTLLRPTLAKLQLSTRKRWLAYDHVGILPAPAGGGTTAIYIARARPDLWKPETKEDHRRRIEAGVWGCRTPADDSDAEFWQARRELCLVHGVAPAAASYGPPPRTLAEREQHDEIYDDDDDDGEVVGHFFADLLSYYAAGGAEGTMGGVAEGVGRKRLSEVKVLNMHLGKAGGLNFGLEAILHSDIVPQPTATHPLFFGIIDARHSCDGRFWKHVMPEFFEVHEIDDQVVFNPNVVLCQLPHSYIGMKASTDKLDVQNNFFFNGMALFRNRCNGMTSCGTGGIWSLTTHENVDDFFFGRTMIEDTTSTHKYFLQGYYSKYIPPLRTSKQLMRAVPKVSANYLEALERWDTGAVQSLLTQGLPRMWFWCTLLFLLALLFAIIAPAFTTGQDVIGALRRPWDPENVFVVFCIFYSAGVLVTVAVGVLVLSAVSPATLNWLLRFLICFFNVTYPFTSIFGLFWMSIPPYVAIMAQFPFRLNAVAAIVGSLVLKMVEFSAMAKLQDASSLDEASIAMTQKMDKVTLPIKLRAIYKGFLTGYADRYHKHDNSFWTSFGTSGALLWVRRWLLLLSSVMSATALIAFIMLIVKATQGLTVFMEVVLPLTFALLTGLHYVWLCYEPFRFVMKGGSLDVAPRWAEVAITVGMLIGLVTIGNMVPRP